MENKGILIVVSGFSGAGKGTIMRALLDKYEETYALSVSATTRDPRPGEVEGREYFFRTVEEFEKMIAKEDLIEYAKYVDNYYGTPRTYVEEQLERGPGCDPGDRDPGGAQGQGKVSGDPAFVRNTAFCRRTEAQAGRPRDGDAGSDRKPDEARQRRSGIYGPL